MRTLLALLFLTVSCFGADDAIDEVNKLRKARGLKPLIQDAKLQEAAERCADYRAKRLIEGHTRNDFEFLPGKDYRLATATGCAAWRDGFGACGLYDSKYKYAGAAVTVGKDGKRYCHVFYR